MKLTKLAQGMAYGLACAVGFSMPALAAEYPAETIHLVVPYKAGGGTDSIARGLAAAIEESGYSVVVDNVTGGSGAIAAIKVAKADPDGYTVLFTGSTDMNALLTFTDMPFDHDSFAFVGGVYDTPTWVLSNKDRGYTDLPQVMELAAASPNTITVGIGGKSNGHDMMFRSLNASIDNAMRPIYFDGGASLKKALIANEVDMGIIFAPVLLSEVEGGLINVLGAGGSLAGITYAPLHDTKTLKDMGLPFEFGVTRGLFLPSGTPDDVVEKLTSIIEADLPPGSSLTLM